MKIVADTHVHSCASSHAYSTVLENLQAAKAAGLAYLAVTEHGPQMPDAPHLWHVTNLHELPDSWEGVQLLRGVEANILDEEGALDIPENLLASLDWVIASMHLSCFAPGEEERHTRAWLQVADNPHVDVIGHCGDQRYRFDYERVIPVFGQKGKIVEINNNSFYVRPGSRENCVRIARLCMEHRVPVVVSSDSHFCAKVGRFETALAMLEEIGFPQELVLNASQHRFAQLVEEKRRQRS